MLRYIRRQIYLLLLIAVGIALAFRQADDEYYPDTSYNNNDQYYEDAAGSDQYAPVAQPRKGGIMTWWQLLLSCVGVEWLARKYHEKRFVRDLRSKHLYDQKAAYSQYYNDIYKLTDQREKLEGQMEQLQNELAQVKDQAELDAIQRDYEEFKQPDLDGDDRISRAEFNLYVKNYLSNYPGLREKDYPQFDDFDHDGDGHVNFQEYATQMAIAVEKAERELAAEKTSDNEDLLLAASLGSGGGGASFEDLYGQYL